MSDLEPIFKLVRRVRRRLVLRDAIASLAWGGFGAGAFLVAISVGAKIAGAWWEPIGTPGAWFLLVAAAALLGLLAWTSMEVARAKRRHASELAVASLVDVKLGLHDRLSIAVAVANRPDPFARAAVDDGLKVAGDHRVAERVSSVVEMTPPRRWWLGPVLTATSLAIWWLVPAISISTTGNAQAQSDAQLQAARDAAKVEIEILQAKIDENPQLKAQLEKGEEGQRPLGQLTDEKLTTPDEVRRETTRAVNEMSKRLDELLKGEKSQQLDALKDALGRVEPAKAGEAQQLAEALKRGDAKAAKAALEELQKKIASDQMDPKSREELSKQLEDLAGQLASASKANDALKKALEGAGLDGALAGNPQAAKAAIDAAKNLNEAQKQELRKALEAQSKANKQLEQVARACKSMGSACKNPGGKQGSASGKSGAGESSGSGESAQQAAAAGSEALSEMEMLNEMLKDAQSARSQCQGGSCSSAGTSAMNNQRGVGNGGERTKSATATGTKSRKEKVAVEGGDVIARQLVDAPPVIGPSRATIEQLSGEIGKGYEEGTEEDPVPTNLREVHKHYFGVLKQKIDAKAAQPPAPAPAPTPAPTP